MDWFDSGLVFVRCYRLYSVNEAMTSLSKQNTIAMKIVSVLAVIIIC